MSVRRGVHSPREKASKNFCKLERVKKAVLPGCFQFGKMVRIDQRKAAFCDSAQKSYSVRQQEKTNQLNLAQNTVNELNKKLQEMH